MWIRSMVLMLAVGCVGTGADDDPTAATTESVGGFSCINKFSVQGIECVGSIAVLPLTVTVTNIGPLDSNLLNIVSNHLNHLAATEGGVTDPHKIVCDIEALVFDDIGEFHPGLTLSDVVACAVVGAMQACK